MTYEYRCQNEKCQHKIELTRRVSERNDEVVCPKCGKHYMVLTPSVPSVQINTSFRE